MTSITQINNKAKGMALGGIKVPHSVSWPVLRKSGSGLVIAYYATVYNRSRLEEGRMPRPSEWMEMDIRDGRLIGRYDCRIKDFSEEPFDREYDIMKKSDASFDIKEIEALYKMFDSVREAYIGSKVLDLFMYRQYLGKICAIIPESYRVFIRELSI